MDDKYSNNEIFEKIEALTDKVKVGFKGMHDRQDRTNGNIKDNTDNINKLRVWRGFIVGGLAVVTATVIPLVIYIFQNH